MGIVLGGTGKTFKEIINFLKKENLPLAEAFDLTKLKFIFENTSNIEEVYKIAEKALGKGTLGEVKKAVHNITKGEFAIKILTKETNTPTELKRLMKEVTQLFLKIFFRLISLRKQTIQILSNVLNIPKI